MKIIFLDIDGVLNCHTTRERDGGYVGIDSRLVAILNRILEETGAYIVISSTWRKFENWEKSVEAGGIRKVIGSTPRLDGKIRGEEVKAWLVEGHVSVSEYAVLDDDSDFLDGQPLFKTENRRGLTPEIADAVIAHLNSNQNAD